MFIVPPLFFTECLLKWCKKYWVKKSIQSQYSSKQPHYIPLSKQCFCHHWNKTCQWQWMKMFTQKNIQRHWADLILSHIRLLYQFIIVFWDELILAWCSCLTKNVLTPYDMNYYISWSVSCVVSLAQSWLDFQDTKLIWNEAPSPIPWEQATVYRGLKTDFNKQHMIL